MLFYEWSYVSFWEWLTIGLLSRFSMRMCCLVRGERSEHCSQGSVHQLCQAVCSDSEVFTPSVWFVWAGESDAFQTWHQITGAKKYVRLDRIPGELLCDLFGVLNPPRGNEKLEVAKLNRSGFAGLSHY